MNTAMQLKALIRNLSREKNINAQILLRNYMLERLLERISLSNYKDNFILKGGMLISAMVGIDMRSTLDMDATIKGQTVSKENVKKMLSEIISIDANDGVEMQLREIEDIRDGADYPGIRASIETTFDGVKNILKVDFTTGDIITPKEVTYKFKLMLENRYIYILAYNLETVLAEKIETIISRGTANTRMRDFYDVYTLFSMYSDTINIELLKKSLQNVAEKRNTMNLINSANIIIQDIEKSSELKKSWIVYSQKYEYAKDIAYEDIMTLLFKYIQKV